MSETEDTVETPYGRLDRAALTKARESYDTANLLRTVGELDEWIAAVQGEDGFASMLLRLHSMARTVINGARMDVPAGEETLPELAMDLIMDLEGYFCPSPEIAQSAEAVSLVSGLRGGLRHFRAVAARRGGRSSRFPS